MPGVLVTLIPGILRGWAISLFITFPESKQNKNTMSLSIQPHYKWRQKLKFLVVMHSLCYIFCSRRTLMLSCALARYLWLKLANVKVSESMLTFKLTYSEGKQKLRFTFHCHSNKLVKCTLIIVPCDTWTVLILNCHLRSWWPTVINLLSLALWSINLRFDLTHRFYFKYLSPWNM